ncbi:predicted protein [Lichtheimia corymbifera JMRC:FSU:9682]|uniref:Uncharacterized protein n=1 Tax=Lichtheimia corymbifera JMRC:FSU:9682 TaxID=1263082 RepID=A0A068RYM4_9FUNG|nr:predicted protein [Lichtheimia corymbifera JMRC:FSU:9682]
MLFSLSLLSFYHLHLPFGLPILLSLGVFVVADDSSTSRCWSSPLAASTALAVVVFLSRRLWRGLCPP